MSIYWPRFDNVGLEESIAPIDYLDWYIPRLSENREHNLSFSGMQFDWDISKLMGDSLFDIAKKHMDEVEDPRQLIAEREGVSIDNVLICNGATQCLSIALIAAISRYHNDQQITVMVESPTYAPIPQSALLLVHEVLEVERNPPIDGLGYWRINREQWNDGFNKSQILMMTPISNPSGWRLHPEDKQWIFERSRETDTTIISDEVYIDAYRNHSSYFPFHKYGNGFISINSLTKIYALGQIRFGWIIADENIIENARRIFMTFSGVMSSPTMRIASSALRSLEMVDDAIEQYRRVNLPKLRSVLKQFEIVWNEPEAGLFGAFQLPNGLNAEDFADGECKENDLLVVPCSMFSKKMDDWVRVCWSIKPEKFESAIKALEKALDSVLK
tara:strand:+ start:3130 stop:4290 length:1161 start_codon:yes stop_codon:yes gene_type:complete